jgi:hypothetical protein
VSQPQLWLKLPATSRNRWPFAAAASQAAAGRDASILSAHTAEEIICVVSVPAATGPPRSASFPLTFQASVR